LLPAEVTDRFDLGSTDGAVECISTLCAAGHRLRMAADRLPAEMDPPAADAAELPAWVPALRAALAAALPGGRFPLPSTPPMPQIQVWPTG